jgi:acylphosphatase
MYLVSTSRECVRIVISGKVQGVFFRSSLKQVADSYQITGWVRNLPDGSVEALLQGNQANLERISEWCKRGPKLAKVEKIETSRVDQPDLFRNFVILS